MKTAIKFFALFIALTTFSVNVQAGEQCDQPNICYAGFVVLKHHNPTVFDVQTWLLTPVMPHRQLMTTAYGMQEESVNGFAILTANRICAAANAGRLPQQAQCDEVRFRISGALYGYGTADCTASE